MPRFAFVLLGLLSFACVCGQPVSDNHGAGGFADVNGAKLWYETKGEGPPIVLIAGGPGSSHSYFHPYFADLANEFQIIFYDGFGRGKSDRAQSPAEYSLARDVQDLEGLRQVLDVETWVVFGQSYGGVVAQAYALKYPSSVERLVLSSTLYSSEMWQAANEYYNLTFQKQFPERWAEVKAARSKGLRSSDSEHQSIYNMPTGIFYYYDASNSEYSLSEYPDHWNAEVYYAIAGQDADFWIGGDIANVDFRSQLKNLPMPILIMHGRYDRMSPPVHSLKYKQYAPQAQFVMFDKSGHSPYREQPEDHIAILREFLRD